MSRMRAVARRLADEIYPVIVRGAHYLTREKQRRAFLTGFEAGWRAAKGYPDTDPNDGGRDARA